MTRRVAAPIIDPLARRREILLARLIAAAEAKDNLLAFARFMRPDPDDMDDPEKSRYVPARPHKAIAHALHEVEAGRIRRLIINCPPRHGKTELASKLFLPWYIGRHPAHSMIFGTYNEKYSRDIGRAVRDVMVTARYRQVFPHVDVREAVAAVDKITVPDTEAQISFTGRGGTITGRGGHVLVIDDPIKDRKEAESPTTRNTLWEWYQDTIKSRMMEDTASIIIIQTRWHADDLVGRLTDPRNDFYDERVAASWHIIDLPALAEENDPLGRKKGEPLWPERFGRQWLEEEQSSNPRGFASLYQGRPTVRGGTAVKEEWLNTYQPRELAKIRDTLRYFVASDHAVATEQDRDKTCILPVGVDEDDVIYVLPEVWWQRAPTNVVVDAMVDRIKRIKPLNWWAEKGHISKSIGPFLRRRMLEENAFASIVEVTPAANKEQRAQSIMGRMAMGRVRFPAFAPWWPEARNQLLTFPSAAHDDFVDALAYIGLGLDSIRGSRVPVAKTGPKPGTFGEMFARVQAERREAESARNGGFL